MDSPAMKCPDDLAAKLRAMAFDDTQADGLGEAPLERPGRREECRSRRGPGDADRQA